MYKLEMVQYLLKRIKEEEELKQEYLAAVSAAKAKAKEEGGYYWTYLKWDGPRPSNSKVKDACKTARSILLEISKESKPV